MKKLLLSGFCLVICCFLFLQTAYSATSWVPTGDIIISLSTDDYKWGNSEFGIYGYGDKSNYLPILDEFGAVSVRFIEGSDGYGGTAWKLYAYDEDLEAGDPIKLIDTLPRFDFYFSVEDAGNIFYTYTYASIEIGFDYHLIDFGPKGPKLTVGYIEQISTPIPTAILLFGSGIIGLVGFRRRTEIQK